MSDAAHLLLSLLTLSVVALSAQRIGDLFARLRLPRITGFLATGLLVGPFALKFISTETVHDLRFVEEIALAFIAFAAGSELYLPELRHRLRSIAWLTLTLLISTMVIVTSAVYLLSGALPFMQDLSTVSRLAVALLAGAIFVSRSPSAAIAIVNELRAKGPMTQLVLGVIFIGDAVVITLFAITTSVASAMIEGSPLNISFVGLLFVDLLGTALVGYALARLLHLILALRAPRWFKTGFILLAGYLAFAGALWLDGWSAQVIGLHIRLEPLLVCLVAGFVLNNTSRYRAEFGHLLHDVSLPIYVLFFTITGAAVQVNVLLQIWPAAVAIFVARGLSIFLGASGGAWLAGESRSARRLAWMGFITQAGVALGLAAGVAVEFPQFGEDLATLIISVVVLNETLGPLLFKAAVTLAGEARPRAPEGVFEGPRDALVLGVDHQSQALTQQLRAQGWNVRLVACRPLSFNGDAPDTDLTLVDEFSLASLEALGARQVEALVAMLPDDEQNYHVCEIAYEYFGTRHVVVRLNETRNFGRFQALGVRIVDPRTAMVSLLDQFVRSPSAAALFLGQVEDEKVLDVLVQDPILNGVRLRDLRLPPDVLLLAIRREGHFLITHGYTALRLGDEVSVVGPPLQLEEVKLRFEA